MSRNSEPARTEASKADEGAHPSGDELLIDGQEEVFSRTEVENGRIEHNVGSGSRSTGEPGGVEPVETSRQRP